LARKGPRSSRRLVGALLVVLTAAAACTSAQNAGGSARPLPPAIGGRLLLASGHAGGAIWSITLPSPRQIPMRTPHGSGYISALVWDPAGGALSVTDVNNRCCTLFALSTSQAPRTLTPGLRANSIQLVGTRMLAAICGRAAVSRISPRPDWRSVATGTSCTAALSPDARWIVYDTTSRTGGAIWRTRADGSGGTQRIVSLASIPQLGTAGLRKPVVVGAVVWGEPGIAFIAGSRAELFGRGEQGIHAVVVVTPAGDTRVIALGSTIAGEVAWQPGGRLLAFTDMVGAARLGFFDQSGYTELRVMDSQSGALRQVATAHVGTAGTFVWRNDGRALAWTQAPDLLRFLQPDGSDLGSVTTEGIPYDWAA
jgi:hypothetical protein